MIDKESIHESSESFDINRSVDSIESWNIVVNLRFTVVWVN